MEKSKDIKVQTTVYLSKTARDAARKMHLNMSDICNEALFLALGKVNTAKMTQLDDLKKAKDDQINALRGALERRLKDPYATGDPRADLNKAIAYIVLIRNSYPMIDEDDVEEIITETALKLGISGNRIPKAAPIDWPTGGNT